ncbi:lipase family protein [Acidisphaera sp. S103]|uniref:alpha/beta hydrolase n=1 Tax=Acidisphaera sp. S103 TaxID=1747223 RepID=UPI00131B9920|nr:lipase family protein [Acidisphaera sp. S103]
MRRCVTVLLAIVLSAGIARAAKVPTPDPSQGDGGVSPFYTWTGDIPDTPGRILRTEPLDPGYGLAAAGEQFRILYTSTDGIGGTDRVVVSGAYFAPRGTPPAGGWPLVAWAHGTTGIADTCAPSWNVRSKRDASYLNTWLGQGYAIVATDYQGLGTPGPHPYLATRPEAYGVLDSVRAVLKGFPDIANKIVIIGQSQGGQAAFASAGLAARYAPELNIRGTVATGVPFTAPNGPRPPQAPPGSADPTAAYSLYIAIRMQQADPSLQPNQLVSARALPLLEQARTTCVAALFKAVGDAGLNREATIGPGFNTAIKPVLLTMEYDTLKLPQPLFVGTGDYDHDVLPARQLMLVRNACAGGTVVEAHLYAGLNHGETVNASLKDSVPFVHKILAGEPIKPLCEPVAE